MDGIFFVNSLLFGVALAMDAFSVSITIGLKEPKSTFGRRCFIAGLFGIFQCAMPLLGWFLLHLMASFLTGFLKVTPYISLVVLLFLGIKMLWEASHKNEEENVQTSFKNLFILGIATSIDALSVGFTIADKNFTEAFTESLIIGVVTYILCLIALIIGKKAGEYLKAKAGYLGGIILIAIGIEIFLTGIL